MDSRELNMMPMGNRMVNELFDKLGPNEDQYSSIFLSYDDVKNLYKVSENHVVGGGVMTFVVTQSPEFWDYLGGLKVLQPFMCYPIGEDPRNNVSISKIDGEDKMLMQEVTISRVGSIVVWSTVPWDISYLTSLGQEITLDIPELVSGFVISSNGHTTDTDVGGSRSEKLTPNVQMEVVILKGCLIEDLDTSNCLSLSDNDLIKVEDTSTVLLAKVKEVDSISNMYGICRNEGFTDVSIHYEPDEKDGEAESHTSNEEENPMDTLDDFVEQVVEEKGKSYSTNEGSHVEIVSSGRKPLVYDCGNYGVTCKDEAKRRNSGTKTKTFEEICYLLLYAVSNKEDKVYPRQLITRIRLMINSLYGVSLFTNTPYAQLVMSQRYEVNVIDGIDFGGGLPLGEGFAMVKIHDKNFIEIEKNFIEIEGTFMIEEDVFNFDTPLCIAFKEFNYLLKIDPDLFTYDIQGIQTYDEYEHELNNEKTQGLDEQWSNNEVSYQLSDHICETYHFKNGITKWATCSSDTDGYCNEGELPGMVRTPEVSLFHLISTKLFSCNALSDLDASINLMPYSLYAKLSLETLKPTKISVRLADRSFQYPVRIAENMLVEVAKFIFPADFVILEMEEDSKVPLILGRPFLHTADAVIRVKHKQLNLGVKAE
ncbi:reverse transcriptase domain-containing protein [Tanacetum coccineum]